MGFTDLVINSCSRVLLWSLGLPLAMITPLLAEESPTSSVYDELLSAQEDYFYAYEYLATPVWWTILASLALILFPLGYSLLEAGLIPARRLPQIFLRNASIGVIAILVYTLVGFNTHYPGDFNGWIKIGGPFPWPGSDEADAFGYGGEGLSLTGYGDLLFQTAFAATVGILAGSAFIGRLKPLFFWAYLILLMGIVYPVIGSWHWGGGWMDGLGEGYGFKDFAGGAMVLGLAGFSVLGGSLALGFGTTADRGEMSLKGRSFWYVLTGALVLPFALGGHFAAIGGAVAGLIAALGLNRRKLFRGAVVGSLAGSAALVSCADILTLPSAFVISIGGGAVAVTGWLLTERIWNTTVSLPVFWAFGIGGAWGILACPFFAIVPESLGESYGPRFLGQLFGMAAVALAAFAFSFATLLSVKVMGGVMQRHASALDGSSV